MSHRFYSVLFLLIATSPAWAEQTKPITLRETLARTLERSPELKTYSWDIRTAEAQVLQAGLRPNPELGVSVENPSGSGRFKSGHEMQQTIQLSQLLELGGKRPARVTEAKAVRAITEWEYEVKRVETMKETTLAFVEVLAAQRAFELAKENLALLEKSVSVAEERVKAAKAATVESIRASVAVRSASIEVEHAEHDLNAVRYKLAASWGAKSVDFSEARGDLESLPELPDIETLRSRLARNPQLARWQTVREAREAALHSQKAQAVPNVTLYGGPRVQGRYEDITGVIGISIPLPFSNRNQGNIAAAQAQLDKTYDEERAAVTRAFAALNATHQELMRASHESVILKTKLLPEAEQAVEQLNASYEAGRGTQLEVQDAKRTLIAARQQHLRALTDYHKFLAEIEALTAAPAHTPQSIAPVVGTPKTKTSTNSK